MRRAHSARRACRCPRGRPRRRRSSSNDGALALGGKVKYSRGVTQARDAARAPDVRRRGTNCELPSWDRAESLVSRRSAPSGSGSASSSSRSTRTQCAPTPTTAMMTRGGGAGGKASAAESAARSSAARRQRAPSTSCARAHTPRRERERVRMPCRSQRQRGSAPQQPHINRAGAPPRLAACGLKQVASMIATSQFEVRRACVCLLHGAPVRLV